MTLTFEGVGSPESSIIKYLLYAAIATYMTHNNAEILPGSGTNKVVLAVTIERSPSLRVCPFITAALT